MPFNFQIWLRSPLCGTGIFLFRHVITRPTCDREEMRSLVDGFLFSGT